MASVHNGTKTVCGSTGPQYLKIQGRDRDGCVQGHPHNIPEGQNISIS